MEQPPSLPERPTAPETPRGGIDIQGGDVRAGRDIVAGDVNIAGDSISGQSVSVQRGFTAQEVQRLILIVGGLVFLTAACFFVFGAVSAATLVATLNRPLAGGDSSLEAARQMQNKIDALNGLRPGQQFRVSFSEEELSSYFRFVLGPAIGVREGKARFTDTGQIVLGGSLDEFNGLPFMAVVNVTTAELPFELSSAWLKVLPTPEGVTLGWIPITPFAQTLNQRINAFLFGRVQFTSVRQVGVTGPEIGARAFLLEGVAK